MAPSRGGTWQGGAGDALFWAVLQKNRGIDFGEQEATPIPTSFDGTEFATEESELPDLLEPWEPKREAEHQAPQPVPEDGGLCEIFAPTGTWTCRAAPLRC